MTAQSPGYAELSNRCASPQRLELQSAGQPPDLYVAALGIRDQDRALEVGCGAGALTRALSASCRAEIWGLDLDGGKVAHCVAAARAAGLDRLRYRQGNIVDTCSAWAGRFSVVYCRYVLMYALPDSACSTLLRGMARCLAPGGRLVAFEADINFAHRFFPPLPGWAVSAFDAVVTHYRESALIDWRRGASLGHVFDLAGLAGSELRIVDGRIIRNGEPAALVEHDALDIEALIAPALAPLGRAAEVARVAKCYRLALRRPDGLCYTPVFAASWRKPLLRAHSGEESVTC